MADAAHDLIIEPILTYPRLAEAGKTYLMTVDLRPLLAENGWPRIVDEELVIYCQPLTEPLFRSQAVGEPAIVLHRFGGTYGPTQFLLTAAQKAQEGIIRINLVNGWGVPLAILETEPIRIEEKVTAPQPETDLMVPRRISIRNGDVVPAPDLAVTDYALVVGIDHYPDLGDIAGIDRSSVLDDLDYAEEGAQMFVDWLMDPEGGRLPVENVTVLKGKQATFQAIQDTINALLSTGGEKQVPIGRRFILYFAGYIQTDGSKPLLIAADANREQPSNIDMDAYLRSLQGQGWFDEIVAFLDCTRVHIGSAFPLPTRLPHWRRIRIPTSSVSVLSYVMICNFSAAPQQRWDFTGVLLNGLRGAAADPQGEITTSSLLQYLQSRAGMETSSRETLNSSVDGDPFVLSKVLPKVSVWVGREPDGLVLGDREDLVPGGERLDEVPATTPLVLWLTWDDGKHRQKVSITPGQKAGPVDTGNHSVTIETFTGTRWTLTPLGVALIQGIPTQSTLRFWLSWDKPTVPSAWLNTGQPLTPVPLLYNGRQVAVLFTAVNLIPNTAYTLSIRDAMGREVVPPTLCRTLSAILPDNGLTLAVGSCYWFYAKARSLLAVQEPPRFLQPDLRFLLGNQIYLDVFNPTAIPDPFRAPDVWHIYRTQWADTDFQQFFGRTPTGVLADDHEFWNGYPHGNLQLPYLSNTALRSNLERDARAAVQAFQLPLNVNGQASFSFAVPPLHFYVLDTRLFRTRYDANPARFLHPQDRADVLQWLAHLPGPGILVMADTLVTNPSPDWQRLFHTMGDVTLGDYGDDFYALWRGLIGAPHDVLLLSGNVHYGCFGEVTVSHSQYARSTARVGKVYECVSSALGLLSSAKAKYDKPQEFDLSGALERHEYLTYTNHFATAYGVENAAFIRFTPHKSGVEFSVHFYAPNNTLLFAPPADAKYVLA